VNLFDRLYLNIGAMKAGTTWLYRQLEQHPQILFSPEKELHYHAARAGNCKALNLRYRLTRARNAGQRVPGGWSSAQGRELLAWYLPYVLEPPWSRHWYRRRFPRQLPYDVYCADFSNLTALVDDKAWERIRLLARTPRLSYMLRHPLDRVWSHLKFLRQLGTSTAAAESLDEGQIQALDKRYDLWRHSQYSATLVVLGRHFQAQELKVLFYDDISARPEGVLRDLEEFLGIGRYEYDAARLGRRINTSADANMPDILWHVFGERLQVELNALEELGLAPPASWRVTPG